MVGTRPRPYPHRYIIAWNIDGFTGRIVQLSTDHTHTNIGDVDERNGPWVQQLIDCANSWLE